MATNNRKIQVYLKEEVDKALEEFKKSKRIDTDSKAVNLALSFFFKLEDDELEQFPRDDSKFITTSDYQETTAKLQSQITLLTERLSFVEARLEIETTSESLEERRLPETISESNEHERLLATTSDSIVKSDPNVTTNDYSKNEKSLETTNDYLGTKETLVTTSESLEAEELLETISELPLEGNSVENTSDSIENEELLENTSDSKEERLPETISNSLDNEELPETLSDSKVITGESQEQVEDNQLPVTTDESQKPAENKQLPVTISELPNNSPTTEVEPNEPEDSETPPIEEIEASIEEEPTVKEALDEVNSPEQAEPFIPEIDPNDKENSLEASLTNEKEEQPIIEIQSSGVNNNTLEEAIKQWSNTPDTMRTTSENLNVEINTKILIEYLGVEEYLQKIKNKPRGNRSNESDAINHWVNTSDNMKRTATLFRTEITKKIIMNRLWLLEEKTWKPDQEKEAEYNRILAAKQSKPSTIIKKKS